MKKEIIPYLIALVAGAMGLFVTMIIWNSFYQMTAVVLLSLIFLITGGWIGRLGISNIFLGWLVLHLVILGTFIPDIFLVTEGVSRDSSLRLAVKVLPIWAVPMAFSLVGLWLGKKSLSEGMAVWQQSLAGVIKMFGNYLLPVMLGLFGMFTVMFFGFAVYMLEVNTPVMVFIYPLVFAALAGSLSYFRDSWQADSLLVCLLPVFYWCVLQPVKGDFAWNDWSMEGGVFMTFIIMPLTVAAALLAGFFIQKRKIKAPQAQG